MKFAIAQAVVLATLVTGCSTEDHSTTKFESAHSIALDAHIEEGVIFTKSENDAIVKGEIREQLMYTIGQTNGFGGGVDMHRLKTEILGSEPVDGEEELKRVSYKADLFVSWPRNLAVPESYDFLLPSKGDWSGLRKFFDAFGSDENSGKRCLAWEAHDVAQSLLWYYYRPLKSTCAVAAASEDLVVSVNASLKVSEENTEDKSPEYGKVWEDDRLVITAIFGKAKHGATSNWDAGVTGFRNTYRDIVNLLGEPTSTNLEGQQASIDTPEIKLTFAGVHGEVDVHLYLVDDIKTVSGDFRAKYNQRTRISDYVSYSGHSGLGANIRALARMGKFEPGHYQVFLINGCDTFAYVDDSLRKAHQEVNPEHGLDKYVDVITNAMPAYFHSMARANISVVEGLLNKEKTYRQILSGFDAYQKAAVTGEQDNNWPAAFIDEPDTGAPAEPADEA